MQGFPRALAPTALVLLLATLSGCGDAASDITGLDPGGAADSLKPQVGVNYNGQLDRVDFADLERSETAWVRGFFDFFLFYQNPERLHDDPKVLNYLELQSRGYRTILNIKWDFRHRSFPEPGSQALEDYEAFLRTMLDRLWSGTDIIVIGNEPFIESISEERGTELLAFYREIARFVNGYASAQGAPTVPIYVGAFNRLDLPFRRAQALDLIRFAASESWIAGVDLHIHHSAFSSITESLDFIHEEIRDDQRILVTEFSLVWHWKSKMHETIPLEFAQRSGWADTTRNYQYIDHALKSPVPRDEWVDFLSSSYWFENRKHYLRNSYRTFREYPKFYIATYAMRQSFPFNRDFTPDVDPWILNGLYANRTVEPDPTSGLNQLNYAWIEDFRAIQGGAWD